MWEPFETHGEIKGRVRGVSLPPPQKTGYLVVWTDAALYYVWFFRTAHVSELCSSAEALARFDADTGVITHDDKTYPMHGACGPANKLYAAPLATEHPAGDRLEPDPDTDSLLILDAEGHVRQTIPNFRPHAEAWSVAGFAGDQSLLVVADPRAVRFFKYTPTVGAEKPRWVGGGDVPQQKQLLRAVLDSPDEDTPRLMYADWLDENRDPVRAEFIRLQCRHAERARAGPVPPQDADALQMFNLERQMKARWIAELPPIHGVRWAGFFRGFPTVAVANPKSLVRAAKKVWAAAPVEWVSVGELQLTGAKALGAAECFEKVRHLSLERFHSRRDGAKCIPALLDTPRAAGLRTLSLATSALSEEDAKVIARSRHLNGLEWLRVGYGSIDPAGAEALAVAPQLKSLKGGPFAALHLESELMARLRQRYPFA